MLLRGRGVMSKYCCVPEPRESLRPLLFRPLAGRAVGTRGREMYHRQKRNDAQLLQLSLTVTTTCASVERQ